MDNDILGAASELALASLAESDQAVTQFSEIAESFRPLTGIGEIVSPLAQFGAVQLVSPLAQLGEVAESFRSLIGISDSLDESYWPHLAALGNFTSSLYEFSLWEQVDARPASRVKSSGSQKLSDREVAAMLTVAVFLLVYVSLGLAIKHNPQLAKLASTDGPTPFEAAMAAGAFTFWAWISYCHRSS